MRHHIWQGMRVVSACFWSSSSHVATRPGSSQKRMLSGAVRETTDPANGTSVQRCRVPYPLFGLRGILAMTDQSGNPVTMKPKSGLGHKGNLLHCITSVT